MTVKFRVKVERTSVDTPFNWVYLYADWYWWIFITRSEIIKSAHPRKSLTDGVAKDMLEHAEDTFADWDSQPGV